MAAACSSWAGMRDGKCKRCFLMVKDDVEWMAIQYIYIYLGYIVYNYDDMICLYDIFIYTHMVDVS